jgi:uncharacterized phage protein (TIGR02218 family)
MSYAEREASVFAGAPYELYLFQTVDQAWRLTSSDTLRSGPGGDYTPTPLHRTALGKGAEQKQNSCTVTIPRDHALAQLFVGYIPSTPLVLTIYRGHEGEAETIVQFIGKITFARFGEDAELNALSQEYLLERKLPQLPYGAGCPKIIYGAACGANPESFRTDATVSAVAGDVLTAEAFGGHADGWFTNGYLAWGNLKRMIVHHVGAQVTLLAPIAGLAPGASVAAYRGCARTYAECTGVFSNGVNFWGFPWIPTRNPFRGVEW